ncbi:MAG: hypothetical protein AB1942_23970 [Pseudomonadota bacterium]
MLFLLNCVVFKLPEAVRLPPGLEHLTRLSAAGVLNAGAELYARHPKLEHERPDIVEWYGVLLASRVPGVGGVLFEKVGERYVGRLAEIDFPLLARLYQMQRDGLSIVDEAQRCVWRQARVALAAVAR